MRAVIFDTYGPPEVLRLAEDVPTPSPGAGEVLVRVAAAGVNPLDWKIRRGDLSLVAGLGFPKTLGADVAGEVVAVGTEVSGWRVGDTAVAMLGGLDGGAYADYAVVPVTQAAKVPALVTPVEAAALPVAAVTALQGLRDHGRVAQGDHVLVNGASGGVGHVAVQIAHHLGARVTAVASGRHQAFLRETLGAERAVNYETEDVRRLDARFDVIFDPAGTLDFWAARPILADGGRFVTPVPGPWAFLWDALTRLVPASLRRGQTARFVAAQPRAEDLRQLVAWAADGTLRPIVSQTYPLAGAAEAHRHAEYDSVRGKLVLET
jgi:NADPH:quinone reductase-like Zn-dependent oxidoreductase